MSEPKRTALTPVLACLVVLMNVGLSGLSWQALAGAQTPRPSAEEEKRGIDAALRRMNQPEARRERQLLDEMEGATERYYRDKNASSRQECESLLAKVLALPNPSARAYSACAAAASMLDRPRQAIEIVKKAIAEYPEESIEGPIVPLKISGYYRIGAFATRIGDVNEATWAYETIITNSTDDKGKEYYLCLCYMYLADLARRTPGNEQIASQRLQQLVKIMESVNKDSRDRNDFFAVDLMKNWAKYELARLEHGSAAPSSGSGLDADGSGDSLMLVAICAIISCPSQSELEQMTESDRPSILRDLAGLLLAIDYSHRSNPFKAEKYLLTVAEGDSYFKAQAKAALGRVREEMTKVREKIRVLLKDLKEGDEKQRERAAFKLLHECGSEGVKALQEAQEDPNKYVRYMAACTLANQSVDRSVKARFDVILDAFADENPEIRSKAQFAVGFRSCLRIGPEETVALIRLMKEHYSMELLGAVQVLLFEVRAKSEIMDAALPELVGLIDQESTDVREGILDIFGRMGTPPAQAVPPLVRWLDKTEDTDTERRIIGMLGQIGPAAKDAIPVLTRYAQHNDVNVRNAAAYALKRISPATVEGRTDIH